MILIAPDRIARAAGPAGGPQGIASAASRRFRTTQRTTMKNLRIRLFLSHLGISAAVIGLSIAFILLVWYPGPLASFEGIYAILVLMAIVDVAAGPLCTLVAASPKKSRGELARDLAIIGAVQLMALGYALYTTGIARPVYVVYNFAHFDVEHPRQIPDAELAKAKGTAYSGIPWFGPRYVEARVPADPAEIQRIIASQIGGGPALKDMPVTYMAWPSEGSDARKRARPVAELWEKGTLRPAAVELLRSRGLTEDDGLVLPLLGQGHVGTIVLRKSDLAVVGILPDQTL
jgi:hypothetical protein